VSTRDRVLVVNAGSSSLKLSLLASDSERPLASRELPAPSADGAQELLTAALSGELGHADAVGHRIVHGGARFTSAVRVDDSVRGALEELVSLAPLHQPASLAALDAVSAQLPGVPDFACFDTGFHAGMPAAASTYALPAEWRARWAVRKYGFHGLSHAWIARKVPEQLRVGAEDLRIVSCHLGSGASLCAISGGHSVDTTMGFTPLAGLVMGTRSGDVDPGLLTWLLEQTGLSESEMSYALEHDSGLKGLAGSSDMRTVLASRAAGDETAGLALAIYLHRLSTQIAAMAAAMGGVDVVAFTGGVGEHAPEIRDEAMAPLGFLGATQVLTIPAREDLEIARQVRAISDVGIPGGSVPERRHVPPRGG
jgi:acetate kinase